MSIPDGTRICALAENIGAGIACKWPMSSIGLYHALGLIQIPQATERAIGRRCCEAWNAVCNLDLHVVESPNGANIVCRSGSIDGGWGVLGQSYLPCGRMTVNSQLEQVLDSGESWDETLLYQVWLHELGHALGLDHAPQGSGAVMEPYLNRSLTQPQAWDIQQMVTRYGRKVVPTPTPTPTPTPILGEGTTAKPLVFPEKGTYLVQLMVGGKVLPGVPVQVATAGSYPIAVRATKR